MGNSSPTGITSCVSSGVGAQERQRAEGLRHRIRVGCRPQVSYACQISSPISGKLEAYGAAWIARLIFQNQGGLQAPRHAPVFEPGRIARLPSETA